MIYILKLLNIIKPTATKDVKFNCLYHDSKSGISCDINNNNNVYCWDVIKHGTL